MVPTDVIARRTLVLAGIAARASITAGVATTDLLPAGMVSVMYGVLLVPTYREKVVSFR